MAAFPPAAWAEPPAVPRSLQLVRAQAANDPAAVAELCRRQLDSPEGTTVADDPRALLTTAFRAYLELADFPRATRTLERLGRTSGTLPAELDDLRGDLARADKRPDDALTAWRAALLARPTDPAPILGKVADVLDAAGRWPEAAEAMRAFLKVRPAHAARRARLAVCLLNLGRAEDADREMLAAVRADAADETVKAAAPMFDRLRPQLPALRALETRIKAGRPPGANPTYDVSAGVKTVESARLDRALLFLANGVNPPALADAAAVAESTGGNPASARLLQAEALRRSDREDEAVRLRVARLPNAWFADRARFDRLRAADRAPTLTGPEAARTHLVRAAILLEADQPVLALEDAERAVRLRAETVAAAPRSPEAEVVLAAALLRCDRRAEALEVARRATTLDPRNADAWAIRGRLEQEGGADLAAAVDSLSRALAIREEPRWLGRRETCLRTLGRTAEADRDARRLAGMPAS